MRNSGLFLLKTAALSKEDQINHTANSVNVPVTSRSPSRGLYHKTELATSDQKIPADTPLLRKHAAMAQQSGLKILESNTKKTMSYTAKPFSVNKMPSPESEKIQQEHLDASQYNFSNDKKQSAVQAFQDTAATRRTPTIGSELRQ